MDAIRDDFGARQAEMTARWYENVKRAHSDVDAYIATRHAAYLDRWKEAARFISDNAQVIDIGGGNIYPQLVDFWKSRGFKYSYLDVDPACVDGAQALATSMGMENTTFDHGYNDALPFSNCSADAIFSSHCLEHSFNLEKTFHEVNRVLKDDGNLLMAVPFGWEPNPEHPYFFGPQEWLSFVTDAGFSVRVAQIGCEYPEQGHDYFVAARKVSPPGTFRLNPDDYTKTSFEFAPHDDGRLRYIGESDHKSDHVIMMGSDWAIEFDVPPGVQEVLPILNHHDWSGIVEIAWDGQSVIEDCYSWFSYVQPVRIKNSAADPGSTVRIAGRGKNASSHSSQGVLHGVLFR